jgi:hypothetical protein
MNRSTLKEANGTATVAVGHIDDDASMQGVCETLAAIHGDAYSFGVARWQDKTVLAADAGRRRFYFVMEAGSAHVTLAAGQRVRGVPPDGPYQWLEQEHWAKVIAPVEESLWPGDVLCVEAGEQVTVRGDALCFCVTSEASDYPLPTVAFLRHLTDRPGGCAAYPGAFRREALPPVRAARDVEDQRRANRVNEHTLDMRVDRNPPPQPHHHGPVAIGAGEVVNHSETALVLPRARYALPEVDEQENGRVVIYRQPLTDPADKLIIPVRPGSVVVTPATVDGVAGHCFENAFAMLVAIPGFVSPHSAIHS